MKRKIMIALVAMSTISLYAQFEKGSTFIGLEGNYIKSGTESGVTTNYFQSTNETLNVGASIGKFDTPHTCIGIGFDYQKGKETRINGLFFNDFMQYEVMKTRTSNVSLYLYMGYYQQIINRFYFSTTVKLRAGTIDSEYSTAYSGVANLKVPDNNLSTVNTESYYRSSADKSSNDYFGAEICPELTYFATKRVGLTLGLGGIGYSMMDWKTDNSSWIVNFNPTYWKFGVKVKI